jgi:hypothetical protein
MKKRSAIRKHATDLETLKDNRDKAWDEFARISDAYRDEQNYQKTLNHIEQHLGIDKQALELAYRDDKPSLVKKFNRATATGRRSFNGGIFSVSLTGAILGPFGAYEHYGYDEARFIGSLIISGAAISGVVLSIAAPIINKKLADENLERLKPELENKIARTKRLPHI